MSQSEDEPLSLDSVFPVSVALGISNQNSILDAIKQCLFTISDKLRILGTCQAPVTRSDHSSVRTYAPRSAWLQCRNVMADHQYPISWQSSPVGSLSVGALTASCSSQLLMSSQMERFAVFRFIP